MPIKVTKKKATKATKARLARLDNYLPSNKNKKYYIVKTNCGYWRRNCSIHPEIYADESSAQTATQIALRRGATSAKVVRIKFVEA